MRVALACLLVVAPALAGCTTPSAAVEEPLALPRIGDRAEYAVSGHLVELARWANGFAITGADARLTLAVEEGPRALDGFRSPHETFLVREELGDAGALSPHRDLYVSEALGAVVQSFTPLGAGDVVVGFDERGYPWAWGASLWHGARLEAGATAPLVLPANGGQAAPLALTLRVASAERVGAREAVKVEALGLPDGASWAIWLAPGVPVPVKVEVRMPPKALDPFVRTDDATPESLRFDAELASFTRGDGRELARAAEGAPFESGQADAEFSAWNREHPPDGRSPRYAPFVLAEAVAWAKLADRAFASWFESHDGAILYRATYLAKAGAIPGTTTHVWLVQYVSRENAFYEVVVERTLGGGSATGVTQVTSSNEAEPPEGNHGWFATEALPDELLTLDSGVAVMRALFAPRGVEIFLRSFESPPGYAYYIDGGFEDPKLRYTVIVNAQTGFVQAAVGPVTPRLA